MKNKLLFTFLTLLCLGFTQIYAQSESEMLELPQLSALDLQGQSLKVTATTSIIADVVNKVGGEKIELTNLIEAGQDPHSYEPSARDLTSVSKADVVFVNGWNLEESLVSTLEELISAPLVSISANIIPLEFGNEHNHDTHEGEAHNEHEGEHKDEAHDEDEHYESEHAEGEEHHHEERDDDHEHRDEHSDEDHADEHGDEHADEHNHHHEGADPHVWQNVAHVMQWVKNVQQVLTDLDPTNASTYANNASAYLEELETLAAYAETTLASIPVEKRFLVSNHDSFSYFAEAYDFEVIGTIIPSNSTLAEPSAADLVNLIEELEFHNMCTLFTEISMNDRFAQTIAQELDHCDNVQILSLYTDALGATGSGADSYISMMQSNIDTFVQGLSY